MFTFMDKAIAAAIVAGLGTYMAPYLTPEGQQLLASVMASAVALVVTFLIPNKGR